jgi:putative NADH-flavin reductase
MRLCVLGATGGVGIEVLRQALERDYTVTAFVRNPAPLRALEPRITVLEGNLLNVDELARGLEGQDAVISCVGPRTRLPRGEPGLRQRLAQVLLPAMERSRVRRLVLLSQAFLFKASIIPPTYLVGHLLFHDAVVDASRLERAVRQSQLEWTIVRPPRLTNGPRTGKYRVRYGYFPFCGFTIARADVAEYLLASIATDDSIRKIVGISR